MDQLKAYSVDFHTTVAATLLRQALEAAEKNPSLSRSQQLAQYTEETFPVLVLLKHSAEIQAVICTTREPFDEFLSDLKRIMKTATELGEFLVRWGPRNEFNYGHVTPENLHVVLRTMQMRPGRDTFELVRRVK